jgi:hypothetical protein
MYHTTAVHQINVKIPSLELFVVVADLMLSLRPEFLLGAPTTSIVGHMRSTAIVLA